MGPMIIFDKSTLQSLRTDEACWLDAFYLPIIVPLFYVETLADLEKEVAKGKRPEQIVGSLAGKTPPNSAPNVHHRTLAVAELRGDFVVSMDGRPVVAGGKPIVTKMQKGVFFAPSPEMEAFTRWQRGRYLEIEREFARTWRRGLSGIDLESVYRKYKCKLRSLEAARDAAMRFITESPYACLKVLYRALEIDERAQTMITTRWGRSGCPPLFSFAPYATHVLSVDLFFNHAIGADLISRERPSNKIDVAYLYYLPFCMIFTSNDSLHERTAKCFLREDQLFLKGSDLKNDLAALDVYYSQLPENVKERGIMSFAHRPPHDGFTVTRLWDRFMAPDWRDHERRPPDSTETQKRDRQLVEHVNRLKEAARSQQAAPSFCAEDGDFMLIERLIPVRMGKWRLLPPEAERHNS